MTLREYDESLSGDEIVVGMYNKQLHSTLGLTEPWTIWCARRSHHDGLWLKRVVESSFQETCRAAGQKVVCEVS